MKTIEALEARIKVLESRTQKENYNIIKKIKRKIKKAEGK